ncbi:MAG: cytochrome c-type biogenesis protein [Alphaproteobacteria bacterium]
MRRVALSFCVAVCVGLASPATAVLPDEVLDDPVLEERARALSTELRCLVCQNQSIDDSNAALARELRILLRERLVEGDTDQEIIDYLVERYGQFVLLKPQFNVFTAILWVAPGLLLAGGGVLALRVVRRRSSANAPENSELSAEEEQKLQKLLHTGETSD